METLTLQASGLGPINANLSVGAVPLHFWAWFYGILTSPNYAIFAPPLHCSGTGCESYFLPGSTYVIRPSFSTFDGHQEAPAFIVDQSVGYQVEFYPPSGTETFQTPECKTYGVEAGFNSAALRICIEKTGNHLLAGVPPHLTAEVTTRYQCMSSAFVTLSHQHILGK